MPLVNMQAEHLAVKGNFEPQRRNHFQVEFYLGVSKDQEIIRLSIESAFLPSQDNEEIEIPWINKSVWVAGKRIQEAGTIKVKDFMTRESAEAIYRWRKKVYDPETGEVGYADNYKKEGSIILTGPDGKRNERIWKLKGCWPKKVEAGELVQGSNEIVVLTVTIRYDDAIPTFVK